MELQSNTTHLHAVELLPWLVNGSLDDEEQAWVEAHVAQCPGCRQEVLALRRLQEAVHSEQLDDYVSTRLAGIHQRIDGVTARLSSARNHEARDEARASAWASWHRLLGMGRLRATSGWRAAALAQALVLIAVGGVWLVRSNPSEILARDTATYHLLSAPQSSDRSPAPDARWHIAVVFDQRTPESEMRALLLALNATLTAGPTAQGAYDLALESGSPERALTTLRASPWVRVAQPLSSPLGAAR